jgi:hypothetical protein
MTTANIPTATEEKQRRKKYTQKLRTLLADIAAKKRPSEVTLYCEIIAT